MFGYDRMLGLTTQGLVKRMGQARLSVIEWTDEP